MKKGGDIDARVEEELKKETPNAYPFMKGLSPITHLRRYLKKKELKQKEDVLLSDKKKELELKEQELNQKEKDLKPTIKKSNQPKVEQQTNKKYIAIIQDPDGYTNVRNGMSTNAKIIDRLFEGEHYEVFPSSDNNWWVVYTQSNVKGYVHKSRIKIIN